MRLVGALLAAALTLQATASRADEEDQPAIQSMRVLGGQPAGRGEFPSLVSIQIDGPGVGTRQRHICGGTVIARNWVLTAGHCVQARDADGTGVAPAQQFVVAEGREDNRQLDPSALRLIRVQDVIRHPGYSEVMGPAPPNGRRPLLTITHDVALLRLAEPANTQPQLLVAGQERSNAEAPGRAATIAGFGETREGSGSSASMMRSSIPTVSMSQCLARYAQIAGFERLLGPSQICAGNRGGSTDTCSGDSGGPLYVLGRGAQLVQAGIVSYGPPCRAPVAGYGVYASVAAHEDFIRQHVADAAFAAVQAAPPAPPQPGPGPGPRPPPNAELEELQGSVTPPPYTNPSLAARVTVDIREGTRLPIGVFATFRVTSSIRGILIVLSRNPTGEVSQVFPNSRAAGFMPGQAPRIISPGQTVLVPGPADGFRAQVQPPTGTGVLIAAVVPESDAASRLAGRHMDLRPIPDAAGFLRELTRLVQSARSMSPELPPTNVAIGTREFTVLPR